jgi:hypothetical protein
MRPAARDLTEAEPELPPLTQAAMRAAGLVPPPLPPEVEALIVVESAAERIETEKRIRA